MSKLNFGVQRCKLLMEESKLRVIPTKESLIKVFIYLINFNKSKTNRDDGTCFITMVGNISRGEAFKLN